MAVASLNIVRRQAQSILNSAGWLNLLLGSISSSSAVLTVTDAAFTPTDIGKTVAVQGAGASGQTLVTTISAYASGTQVTLVDTASTTATNAVVSYGGKLEDDARTLVELDDAIFSKEDEINLAVLENPRHWSYADYVSLSSSIAHAARLPARVGDIEDVLIKKHSSAPYIPGVRLMDVPMIQDMRSNTGTAPYNVYGTLAHNVSGSTIAGLYEMDDGYLYYTGYDAKVRCLAYARSTTALQCNVVFTGYLARGAAGIMFAKDGSDLAAAAACAKAFEECIALIRRTAPREEFQQ